MTNEINQRVGVGMICINLDTGNILMGKRLSLYGYNTWNNPGGKINLYEDPKRAALREVLEETNLTFQGYVRKMGYLTEIDNSNTHWITLMFAGFVKDPAKLRNCEPTKHSEWRWFSPWDLPEDTWEPMKKWWRTDEADDIKRNIEFLCGRRL